KSTTSCFHVFLDPANLGTSTDFISASPTGAISANTTSLIASASSGSDSAGVNSSTLRDLAYSLRLSIAASKSGRNSLHLSLGAFTIHWLLVAFNSSKVVHLSIAAIV